MKRIVLLFGCMLAMQINAQAGDLYRWLDSSGGVHYGDMPPAGPTQVEAIELAPAPPPDIEWPYETRRAQQNFPVTLYLGEKCAEYCKLARSLLNKRGIPFTEKILTTKEEIDTFKALSGGDIIPTLAVGKNFLKGFLEESWQFELDIAGYPKTAPYRPANLPVAPVAASQVAPAEPMKPNPSATP
ncbi:MAG: glutaredoxin family protein [Nitrosomonadales bacterium]|nr:glutaredoxin family protein [Nitrosomonadales bacterium]